MIIIALCIPLDSRTLIQLESCRMSDLKILYMLLLELKNAVNKLKENNKIINIMHYAIVHYLFIQ